MSEETIISVSSREEQKIEADTLAFYHINDVHSHLDEFRSTGTDCTNPSAGCFGGYARVKTVLEATRPGHNDSLFLNVGDEFQVSSKMFSQTNS